MKDAPKIPKVKRAFKTVCVDGLIIALHNETIVVQSDQKTEIFELASVVSPTPGDE